MQPGVESPFLFAAEPWSQPESWDKLLPTPVSDLYSFRHHNYQPSTKLGRSAGPWEHHSLQWRQRLCSHRAHVTHRVRYWVSGGA